MSYTIKQGDCLELMKNIPDGSVDMILCDLPYGTMKGAKLDGWNDNSTYWDNRIETSCLFSEYERVLRENGIAVLFSQEPYTSQLRSHKQLNFDFIYPLIWKKDHFANALLSKKAPVSYFEDLSVFHKKYDRQNKNELRLYAKEIFKHIGLSKSQIDKKLGHQKAQHFFRYDSMQFKLCTEKTYQEISAAFSLKCLPFYKSYKELQKLNDKYKKNFNLCGKSKFSNVLEFKKDYQGFHPTQKPVALLEYLIKTYTNENETVLDNCMGSGSTGVACINTDRDFIGFELDENYFNIAQERLRKAEDEHVFIRKRISDTDCINNDRV